MAKRIKKKKQNTKKRVLIIILIIIIVLISGFFFLYNKYLGDMNKVEIDEDELDANESLNTNIINIALFGIDTREDDYDGSRSDTIMIATLDKEHQKIKLTSIMRDTYLSIPGEKYDKINHSYAYGGPALTIKTINQNFDMNIKDFVTVNFTSLEKIVDAVDGVEIDLKQSEVSQLNGILSELNKIAGNTVNGVSSSGLQTLNGRQAVAYCRIRYVGNADYERTERQRSVLEKVLSKVMNNKSLSQALTLIETLSPYIETSLSNTEMIGLATTVFTSGISEMEDTRVPVDGYFRGGTYDGVAYLKPKTLVDNAAYLHEFIYENEDYSPSVTVSEISETINK
ncbi:MAG: LCP family protein [Eubacteriales bacterium]